MAKTEFTVEQQAAINLQIQNAVDKHNKELELRQAQREKNVVVLGATVVSKREHLGSPIIDKETKQQKLMGGVPQCYPTKYYVTLQAMGLELETEITVTEYDAFQDLRKYLCEGRMGIVKKFGTEYVEPIFTKYTLI